MSNPLQSERRLNLLTGEWVLVSPQRLTRPWQGDVSAHAPVQEVHHDPDCYLCPRAERAGGVRNPDYAGVFVFDNDFPALVPAESPAYSNCDSLLVSEPESGLCRVICYSPGHSRAMSRLALTEIRSIVDVWAEQFAELDARADVGAVTIFENRGAMMGASNPHPHGQIWATRSVPNELAREDARQRQWRAEHAAPMLVAYLEREIAAKDRIVALNDTFAAVVPFWAAWPFEILVLPRRSVESLERLDADERDGLAHILSALTQAYDALFGVPFPYSMGLHQRPSAGPCAPHFTLHIHFYPPLLRSASIRKFMVGFEMLAMPQRDLTPEDAAARLRIHVHA